MVACARLRRARDDRAPGRHVIRLVEDLLDVSRIARGKVLLKHEELEPAEIVAKAVEMTDALTERRHHHLAVGVPRDLRLAGDAARLKQVISNLLTNAAKYTDHCGHIMVTAARTGADMQVVVADNGRGSLQMNCRAWSTVLAGTLLGLGLPAMDGFEVARQIRAMTLGAIDRPGRGHGLRSRCRPTAPARSGLRSATW